MWRGALAVLMMGVGISALAVPARAQAIDYGALENLFGEPVTTSVTGSPQRASDVPAAMTIITADEIRRSGARDIPGVLRHVAGIDILQWTNDQADVAVRGYNQPSSPRLLVLIDGRQVYTDYYGYTPWSTLPVVLSDIRQIEIVRGPNSALFGFNAVGGVINIITYNPLFDEVNTLSGSGGTQGMAEGSAVITHKFGDDAGVRLSVLGQRNNDFSTPQRPPDIGTRQGTRRIAADLAGRVRLGADAYAGFDVSHSEVRLPEVSPLYSMFFVRYRTSSVKASLSADTRWGLLRATSYANWFKVNAQTPILPSFPFSYETTSYVTQLEDIFKLGRTHTIRISAEYRHDSIPTAPVTGADVSYDLVAGGAMWQWAITPALTLTNAIRVDHVILDRTGFIPPGFGLTNADWHGVTFTEPSFNSGIVWKIDAENTLRLTAARGVQLPNLLNLGGLVEYYPSSGYTAGVPFLTPEIVMNYEIGLTRDLPAFDAEFIVRLFHQNNRDIISNFGANYLALGLVSTPANIGSSDATGLELSLKGKIGDAWRWGLSYTPEVIDDHFLRRYPLALTIVDYQDTTPVHVVNANLGWSGGPWEVDGYLRYESGFHGIYGGNLIDPVGSLVPIPGYVSVDGRLAYRLTDHLTLAVSGQNLLDSPQRQTSAPEVERRVFATLRIDF